MFNLVEESGVRMPKFKVGDRVEVATDKYDDISVKEQGKFGIIEGFSTVANGKKTIKQIWVKFGNNQFGYESSGVYFYEDLKLKPWTKLEKAMK